MSAGEDGLALRKLGDLIQWQKYQEEQVRKAEQFNARLKRQLKEILDEETTTEDSFLVNEKRIDMEEVAIARLSRLSRPDVERLDRAQEPTAKQAVKQTAKQVDTRRPADRIERRLDHGQPLAAGRSLAGSSDIEDEEAEESANYAIFDITEEETVNTIDSDRSGSFGGFSVEGSASVLGERLREVDECSEMTVEERRDQLSQPARHREEFDQRSGRDSSVGRQSQASSHHEPEAELRKPEASRTRQPPQEKPPELEQVKTFRKLKPSPELTSSLHVEQTTRQTDSSTVQNQQKPLGQPPTRSQTGSNPLRRSKSIDVLPASKPEKLLWVQMDAEPTRTSVTRLPVRADDPENCPIRPAIDGDGVKTFEQFLEHRLGRLDENLSRSSCSLSAPEQPKRHFLRKGTGLSRYRHYSAKADGEPTPTNRRRDASRQNGKSASRSQSIGSKTDSGMSRLNSHVSRVDAIVSRLTARRPRSQTVQPKTAGDQPGSTPASTTAGADRRRSSRVDKAIGTEPQNFTSDVVQRALPASNRLASSTPARPLNKQTNAADQASKKGQAVPGAGQSSRKTPSVELVSTLSNSPACSPTGLARAQRLGRDSVIKESESTEAGETFDALAAHLMEAIRRQDARSIESTLRQLIKQHFRADVQRLLEAEQVAEVTADRVEQTSSGEQVQQLEVDTGGGRADAAGALGRPSIDRRTCELRAKMETLQRQFVNIRQNLNQTEESMYLQASSVQSQQQQQQSQEQQSQKQQQQQPEAHHVRSVESIGGAARSNLAVQAGHLPAELGEELRFLREQVTSMASKLQAIELSNRLAVSTPQTEAVEMLRQTGQRKLTQQPCAAAGSADPGADHLIRRGERFGDRSTGRQGDKRADHHADKFDAKFADKREDLPSRAFTDRLAERVEASGSRSRRDVAAGETSCKVKPRRTIDCSGATEKRYRNGTRELYLEDGTIWRIFVDGTEIIDFLNGEREIRTIEYRRRELLDGTTKTVYADGTQETRYPSGRLRVKDKHDNLIADSKFFTGQRRH